MVIDQNFIIGCSTNSIKILELQKEGKRAMKTEEFLIGNKISIGEKLNLMFNYQIIIEYDGTNFLGWQKKKRKNNPGIYRENT